jgi:superfamily II DNA or RNA helicase
MGGFTERTRRRGRALVEEGDVAIEGASADTVLAFVRGDRPRPYSVAVDFSEVDTRERVRVECNCAYFRDGYPCEHVFATLVAIEAADLSIIDGSTWSRRLDVVPYRAGLPTDDDWFFEGDDAFSRRQEFAEAFFEGRGRPREPDWQGRLQALSRSLIDRREPFEAVLSRAPVDRVEFRIEREKTEDRGRLIVGAYAREPDPEHPSGKLVPLGIGTADLDRIQRDADRKALRYLLASPLTAGLVRPDGRGLGSSSHLALIPPAHYDTVLPALVATGGFRCPRGDELRATGPIQLDDGGPWRFRVHVSETDPRTLDGELYRDDAAFDVRVPLVVIRDGLVLFEERLAPLEVGAEWDWLVALRREGAIAFPVERTPDVLAELTSMKNLPELRFEPEGWTVERPAPVPAVRFHRPDPRGRHVIGEVEMSYGDIRFRMDDERSGWLDTERQRFVERRPDDEERALEQLGRAGARPEEDGESHRVLVRPSELNGVVRRLVHAGFEVRADGRLIRALTARNFRVKSGVDWFDLEGELDFEGTKVGLPEVLRAVREGDGVIDLGDGTEGVLPDEWIRRVQAMSRLAQKKDGTLRFGRSQALMLDVLLDAADAELDLAPEFLTARAHLGGAARIDPDPEPEGFEGTLREYQRRGLAWLGFLDRAGLGGCLADDMGLGKTVQVLAHLQRLHVLEPAEEQRPSLVVAPRSLIYNWLAEAARFTPKLRVLDYTGSQRGGRLAGARDHDVVITTYGTVRRDIADLREMEFDHVILDEAQAIKNPGAQSSKACRLLRGRRRMALSGTPVENDASELWSIFEFLNPRMLGSRREFQNLIRTDGESLALVARGLRPLLLRRTKEQVLSELPEKTELTIHCQLGPTERRVYDELRDYYRQSVQQQIAERGLSGSRMHVLEALLRLRQASCHLGLIDAKYENESSAKVDTLVDHLQEVIAEGHKALVFSQFVQLLSLVRTRLDREAISYAYLDGQTQHREVPVRKFMEEDDCGAFLISLKAGGLGLNLTAADYVFILDPWWNPAVETQAIDRAHRIGQTRPVFAYRYVAQETVEEKIIQLHAHKRKLADALVRADDQATPEISLEDLRMLLGA